MKNILALILLIITNLSAFTQQVVKIDPSIKYQKIEGWGVSLAWWANIIGGWEDMQVKEIAKWITDQDELNMNIFRFNIAGGDDPTHNHMRNDGAAIPGYKPLEGADFDWSQDANQRKILLAIQSLRPNSIFEAESYSPPYYLTKSGCTAGFKDGSDNLKDDRYADFADYLTEVVKHYKEKYGLVFRTLSPMNEPFSSWWKEKGRQEGCAFSQLSQHKLIKEVYAKLKAKNMLQYCSISVMDANSMDECLNGIKGYVSAGDIMPLIGQINTHSYAGSGRSELHNLVLQNNKPVWQSESGPLDVKLSGMDNFLFMAQRIIIDMQELKPVAWCDWQIMAHKDPHWGLISYDMDSKSYKREKSYYMRMQFTRFIKAGYTILQTGDSCVLAAIDTEGRKLVAVIVNSTKENTLYSINLDPFKSVGNEIQMYRSSQNENCLKLDRVFLANQKKFEFTAVPKSITTILIPVVSN